MDDKDMRIYFEPLQNRWHTTFECQVILSQEDIELVLCREPPQHSRPCTICAIVREPCD